MKCRFHVAPGSPESGPPQGKEKASGPVPDAGPRGFGVGGEPQKRDLLPPPPDLDDSFEGRGGAAVGGYQAGGIAPGVHSSEPAPGDAYALMTGGSQLSPGDVFAGRPVDEPRPSKKKKSGRKTTDRKLERELSKSLSKGGRGKASPPPGPPLGSPFDRPIGEPPPMMPPPPTPPPPRGTAPPGGAFPMPGAPRRAGPKAPRGVTVGTARGAPARPKPGVERKPIDWSFLAGAKKLLTARNVMTVIVGFMMLFALIFAVAGKNYFVKPERAMIDEAIAAMDSLPGYRIAASEAISSSAYGPVSDGVQVEVARGSDLHALYTTTTSLGPEKLEVLSVGGEVYDRKGDGQWGKGEKSLQAVDFSADALFRGASEVTLIDKQVVDGVNCDHFSFNGGVDIIVSLFPKSNAGMNNRGKVEVWIDDQDRVRRVKLDTGELNDSNYGDFSAQVDLVYSDFNMKFDIHKPI